MSLNTLFTAIGICHTSYVDCLLADSQHSFGGKKIKLGVCQRNKNSNLKFCHWNKTSNCEGGKINKI